MRRCRSRTYGIRPSIARQMMDEWMDGWKHACRHRNRKIDRSEMLEARQVRDESTHAAATSLNIRLFERTLASPRTPPRGQTPKTLTPTPKPSPVSLPTPKPSPVSLPTPKPSPVSLPTPKPSPVSLPTPQALTCFTLGVSQGSRRFEASFASARGDKRGRTCLSYCASTRCYFCALPPPFSYDAPNHAHLLPYMQDRCTGTGKGTSTQTQAQTQAQAQAGTGRHRQAQRHPQKYKSPRDTQTCFVEGYTSPGNPNLSSRNLSAQPFCNIHV